MKADERQRGIRKQGKARARTTATSCPAHCVPFLVWDPLKAELEIGVQVVHLGGDPKMQKIKGV